jgi:hypothetical protein
MRGSLMHFDILVEDQSGKILLENIVPKIIGNGHTFDIKAYKEIGKIPKGLKPGSDPNKRILLDQIPRILKGYGKTYSKYPKTYQAAVIVVCDLDDKCLKVFRGELFSIIEKISIKPETRFCFAIEESEAWLLGDLDAIYSAYSRANKQILKSYKNDSICGTWELLADAISPNGADALKKKGWYSVGKEKSLWAQRITPFMEIQKNKSPSFQYFCRKMFELLEAFSE